MSVNPYLAPCVFRENYLIVSGAGFVFTTIINVQKGLRFILLAIFL